jgi:hypothetical protein
VRARHLHAPAVARGVTCVGGEGVREELRRELRRGPDTGDRTQRAPAPKRRPGRDREPWISEGPCEVERLARPRPPTSACVFRRTGVDAIEVGADAERVGDRRRSEHAARGPVPAGGLEDPRATRVGDRKRAVVAQAAAVGHAPALFVPL